jgi:NADP-dependent 3-hydroxy acid dehydrogenase YdfG
MASARTLAGKTAVVTGASRGIGARLAEALGESGARVVLLARTESTLRERSAQIKGSIAIAADVTDPQSVERAASRIMSELGNAPDIFVNNAGIFSVAALEETKADVFIETINTNLVGPFLFVRSFLGAMKKRKSGHIVTIGSVADRTVFPGNAAYSAAKFGLRAVHEVMRAELRGTGVRATLISPSRTDTEIWKAITVPESAGRAATPVPMLDPDDVVGAVMFALTQPDRVNIDELRLSHS